MSIHSSLQCVRFIGACLAVATLVTTAAGQKPTPADPGLEFPRVAPSAAGEGAKPAPSTHPGGETTRLQPVESDARAAKEARATLDERNRVVMHPGDPLTVVGLEQGENEIRSRTPILQQLSASATRVDVDELRDRALAMYSDRVRFQSPPVSQSALPPLQVRPGTHGGRRSSTPETSEDLVPTAASWPWFVLGGALFGAAFWWLRRSPPTSAGKRSGGLRAT